MAAAADFNAPFEACLDGLAYLGAQRRGLVSVLNFGADPTGVADSSPAFVAAEAAAFALGPGAVVLAPGGSYKLNAGFNLRRGVSLVGDGATLYHNHNSQNIVTLLAEGTARSTPQVIAGIAFESLTPTSGYSIFDVASGVPRELVVRECSHNWGSQNIAGSFYSLNSAASHRAIFERVKLRARDNGDSLLYTNGGSDSYLEVAGGRFKMASDYSSALVTITNTPSLVQGAYFDMAGHAAGTAHGVNVSGPADKRLFGNAFFQAGDGASIAASGRIVEAESDFLAGTSYDIAYGALTAGSRLGGAKPVHVTSGSLGPFSIDALGLGVRAVSYKLTGDFGSGGPTFAMPTALFPEQRFTLTVANKHASVNWSGITFTGGGQGNAGATNINRGRTFQFIALDIDQDGNLDWILTADPTFDWIA